MRFAWFLLFAVALASGVPGCLSAARDCWSGAWLESGDGFLFWFTWMEDPGFRRLVAAAAAALFLILAAAASSRLPWLRPADLIVRTAGKPALAAAAVALAVLPHLVAASAGPATEGRPKVLVVLLDTVRLDHVGWGGAERDTTPRLDALAARGVAFEQAISPSSWTKPAVASILTGLVPSRHQAVGRPTLDWYSALPADRRTAAEAFARAGYFTAAVSSNPNVARRYRMLQGFHETLKDTRLDAEQAIEVAEGFLGRAGDRPFFLYLHLNDAHYPYEAPAPYLGLYGDPAARVRLDGDAKNGFRLGREDWGEAEVQGMRDGYDEEIRYLDEQVGAFVERMLAEHDDLVVAILSDHGEEFLEHGDIGHGHTLNEEQLRVPFQLAWGEAIDLAPRRVTSQVSTLDLLPTLLELAGLGWPEGATPLDGRSLLPVLRGEEGDRPAFAETDSPGSPRSGWSGPLRAWRRPDAKLVITDPWSEQAGRSWLYDLVQDPGEGVNLAGEGALLRQTLADELQASGWLIEKEPLRLQTADTSDAELAELAELGYVDQMDGLETGQDPEFQPGAVPWWQPRPETEQ